MGKSFSNIKVGYSGTIWWIVICGFAGFLASILLLLGFQSKHKTLFHEISINFKNMDIVGTDSVKRLVFDYHQKYLSIPDSLKKGKTADSLNSIIQKIRKIEYQLQFGNSDTAVAASSRFSICRDSIVNMIARFRGKDSLVFAYYNPELYDSVLKIQTPIIDSPHPNSMSFFSKYPNFAVWVFLGIFQMVMWFLMLPICLSLFKRVYGVCESYQTRAQLITSLLKSLGLAFGAVLLFCLVLFFVMIDENIVKDKYFMNGFDVNLTIYSMIGYLVAAVCFTGFLFIADFIHRQQIEYSIDRPDDPEDEANIIKGNYILARKFLNIFLVMTGLVLTVVVLWVGSMFSAINSMEIFRYYKLMSGTSFLPPDFVYLFGGVNSMLILIFYLPAKFNMFRLNLTIPELIEPAEKGDSKSTDMLKRIGRGLADVLVVSSPLLASLIQNLLK